MQLIKALDYYIPRALCVIGGEQFKLDDVNPKKLERC